MTPKHVAASMAALNQAGTAGAAPISAGAGSGTAYDASLAAARKAGAVEERTRIGAILNHGAAAGRGKLAAHLAFKTSMSVDDAAGMLAASTTGSVTAAAAAAGGAAAETLDWGSIVADLNATIAPQLAAQVEESAQ